MTQSQHMEKNSSRRLPLHHHESGIAYTARFLRRFGQDYANGLADTVAYAQEEVGGLTVQRWELYAHSAGTGWLHCYDVKDGKEIYMETLSCLDSSLDEMHFYCMNNTIMLPRES